MSAPWYSNVIGREPEISWTTTGGDLEEKRNGSIAQVAFDTPVLTGATVLVCLVLGLRFAEIVDGRQRIDVRADEANVIGRVEAQLL